MMIREIIPAGKKSKKEDRNHRAKI